MASCAQAGGEKQIPTRVHPRAVGKLVVLARKTETVLDRLVDIRNPIVIRVAKESQLGLLHGIHPLTVRSDLDTIGLVQSLRKERPLLIFATPDSAGSRRDIHGPVRSKSETRGFKPERHRRNRHCQFPNGVTMGQRGRFLTPIKRNRERLLVGKQVLKGIPLVLLTIGGQSAKVGLAHPIVQILLGGSAGLDPKQQTLLVFIHRFKGLLHLPKKARFFVRQAVPEPNPAITPVQPEPFVVKFAPRLLAEGPGSCPE